jgi:hypothetical protein
MCKKRISAHTLQIFPDFSGLMLRQYISIGFRLSFISMISTVKNRLRPEYSRSRGKCFEIQFGGAILAMRIAFFVAKNSKSIALHVDPGSISYCSDALVCLVLTAGGFYNEQFIS